VETLGPAGLAAFAFLPLHAETGEAAEILRRSYAVAGRRWPTADPGAELASAMVNLGSAALEAASAPQWLVEVAYASGVSLRPVAAMWRSIQLLATEDLPEDLQAWAQFLVRVVEGMPLDIVRQVLRLSDLDGTAMRALADEEAVGDRSAAWAIFRRAVDRWLAGDALTTLAAIVVRPNAAGNDGRGSGNPLPKIIGVTEQVFVFGLSRLAGCLALLIATAELHDPGFKWRRTSRSGRALEQLSIAVRAGCTDDGSLAWWRFGGVRQRRLAHLAASVIPVPGEVLDSDDSRQREWLTGKRESLLDPSRLADAQMPQSALKALTALALLETE
jgi:hypothetical protein